jgi:hypothetical protein
MKNTAFIAGKVFIFLPFDCLLPSLRTTGGASTTV